MAKTNLVAKGPTTDSSQMRSGLTNIYIKQLALLTYSIKLIQEIHTLTASIAGSVCGEELIVNI